MKNETNEKTEEVDYEELMEDREDQDECKHTRQKQG